MYQESPNQNPKSEKTRNLGWACDSTRNLGKPSLSSTHRYWIERLRINNVLGINQSMPWHGVVATTGIGLRVYGHQCSRRLMGEYKSNVVVGELFCVWVSVGKAVVETPTCHLGSVSAPIAVKLTARSAMACPISLDNTTGQFALAPYTVRTMQTHPIFGWLTIAAGAFILLIAVGVIDNQQPPSAPSWIVGLAGAVFVIAGIMLLLGQRSRYTALGAAFICALFAAIGIWIAFLGPSESITGGLPFLPRSMNAKLGRTLFGLGGVISLGIGILAVRDFVRRRPTKL